MKNKKEPSALELERILEKKGLLKRETILENIFKNEKFLGVSKIILVSLLAVGIVTLAAAAPGALRIFQPFLKRHREKDIKKTKRILSALKSRNLINVDFTPEGWVITLTEKGKERALKCYLKALSLKYKKWDGKWRLVIFDIPTKLNRKRDALREFLKHMGFKELQKSIYISPYPCWEEIEAILEYLQLKPYVKFFEANFFEEELLKKRFNL